MCHIVTSHNSRYIVAVESYRFVQESTDLFNVIDKLHHIMLYRVYLTSEWNRTRNFCSVISLLDGRCKFNYLTIKAYMATVQLLKQ